MNGALRQRAKADYSLRGIRVSYKGSSETVLDLPRMDIPAGTHVAVMGANAAGKSTLARLLAGTLAPDCGTVLLDGRDIYREQDASFLRNAVALVMQNPDEQGVCPLVEDDVAFGPANLGLSGSALRARVDEALETVGLADNAGDTCDSLSGGQLQRLNLAGALAMHPAVLICDEVTSMLDPAGVNEVNAILDRTAESGVTVINITHSTEEASRAQRVIVLKEGRIVADGHPHTVLSDIDCLHSCHLRPPFTAQITEALLAKGAPLPDGAQQDLEEAILAVLPEQAFGPADRVEENERPGNDAAPLLTFERVRHDYRQQTSRPARKAALEIDHLEVFSQEIVGLCGATGSGKTTFALLAAGLLKPDSGSVVRTDGQQTMQAGDIGLVMQYPERQFFRPSVLEDVSYGAQLLGLPEHEVHHRAVEALRAMGVEEALFERSPFTLSGGQQRRVALAGALVRHPRLLILDEPTAGLDAQAAEQLEQRLSAITAENTDIVLISHDMDALARVCTRIIALDDGRIAADGTPCSVFSDRHLLHRCGLRAPRALELSQRLRMRGVALPLCTTSAELVSQLGALMASTNVHG